MLNSPRSGEVLVAGPGALTRSHSKTTLAAGPCTPAYAGLTRVHAWAGRLPPSTPACAGLTSAQRQCKGAACLYPHIYGADAWDRLRGAR